MAHNSKENAVPPRPVKPPPSVTHSRATKGRQAGSAPSKYQGRTSEDLLRFCEQLRSDFDHLLIFSDEFNISIDENISSLHIIEGLRPAIVSHLFTAGD